MRRCLTLQLNRIRERAGQKSDSPSFIHTPDGRMSDLESLDDFGDERMPDDIIVVEEYASDTLYILH